MIETPLCPHCHQPSVRNGRRRFADGLMHQRYRCQRCECAVYRIQPPDRGELFRRFCRMQLDREKVIYAAEVLGVTTKCIVNYRARLRRNYDANQREAA
jgi:hypothetical protein